MAFRGWPSEALAFFEGLIADNSKSYWQANKQTYERAVRLPMEDLLDELEPEFGPGRVFRPNRDVRFSHDKSPYKTNIAAHIGDAGYVSLSADGLGVGSGMYMMSSDQLERYRAAVDAERSGKQLVAIAGKIRQQGHDCGPHDALKTAPRGYPKDHPRIDLLRAKGLTSWHHWPPGKWLATAKTKDRIIDVLRASRPLNSWLAEHVGPPRS
jgi:uncharacterized protein (TIGR02453 family)